MCFCNRSTVAISIHCNPLCHNHGHIVDVAVIVVAVVVVVIADVVGGACFGLEVVGTVWLLLL